MKIMSFILRNKHHNSSIMRLSVLFILCVFITASLNAQQEKSDLSLRDRLFFGGNFGLQFGSVTRVEISPLAGYRITPRFSSGIGITYIYRKEKTIFSNFETSIYGGKLFSRYTLIQDFNNFLPIGFNGGVFAQTEYEPLNLETSVFYPFNSTRERYWYHGVFAGGGLSLPLGGRASINVMFLYDLNHSTKSPYAEPYVFRFGINF